MRSRKLRTAVVAAATALSAAAATAVLAAPAEAAPLPVTQVPASGLQVSGLVVPAPLFVGITADSTDRRGWTAFTAPASPAVCSSSAAGMMVDVDYLNTTTGYRGHVRMKPCPNFRDPTPFRPVAYTGSGQIAFTSAIRGSWAYPNAGQPSVPGGGTFVAR
ncbi:MAG: hypothetical protein QM809_16075 [Gordonia sp. (in: high G+C Gram-positive bacteria)]|uniref:hypothetical protein n=1 Tax=Gordonia sp. (in: high G+C Gram-positive bacteria) TaxID=84139 RepID=UPI0039E21E04